jgi:hypothetical protein
MLVMGKVKKSNTRGREGGADKRRTNGSNMAAIFCVKINELKTCHLFEPSLLTSGVFPANVVVGEIVTRRLWTHQPSGGNLIMYMNLTKKLIGSFNG